MATNNLHQRAPISNNHQDPPPLSAKLTNRQIGLIIGRRAVAALLGELDPITFNRSDLHTAKSILGELIAETEVAQ